MQYNFSILEDYLFQMYLTFSSICRGNIFSEDLDKTVKFHLKKNYLDKVERKKN